MGFSLALEAFRRRRNHLLVMMATPIKAVIAITISLNHSDFCVCGLDGWRAKADGKPFMALSGDASDIT